jgi:hypothetical protein
VELVERGWFGFQVEPFRIERRVHSNPISRKAPCGGCSGMLVPQGLKPNLYSGSRAARLKSCPSRSM